MLDPRPRHAARAHLAILCLAGTALLCGSGCDATIGAPHASVDAAAAVDARPNDATGNDGALPVDASVDLLSCDESYGTAPDYVLCEQRDDACVFSATTNGGNCNEMCAALGGVCIEAFDNDPGAPCVANPGDNCATTADDEICVCTRL